VQLAHTADDGLAGLVVLMDLERRILLVLGSMATSITGSGKVIDSSTTCWFGSLRVSPVVVSLRPMTA
jgi:hypothetical protein